MKRIRFHSKEKTEKIDSFNLANLLMLLSRSSAAAAAGETAAERMFECQTCNRQFTSFQALGGHRASHKKHRLGRIDGLDQVACGLPKRPVHECSVCGLEFSMGQALGGHMRRHRAVADTIGPARSKWAGEKESVCEKLALGLDLNLLPPLEAAEVNKLPMRMGFTLTPGIVDCL